MQVAYLEVAETLQLSAVELATLSTPAGWKEHRTALIAETARLIGPDGVLPVGTVPVQCSGGRIEGLYGERARACTEAELTAMIT